MDESEAVYQAYMNFQDLVRGGQVTPSWILGGPSFWYAEGGPQDRVIWRVDPETNRKVPLFDVERLRSALTESLHEEPAGHGVPFAQLEFVGERSVKFALADADWTIDLDSYDVARLPAPSKFPPAGSRYLVSEAERVAQQTFFRQKFIAGQGQVPERPSPDGHWFASVRDHNIALRATVDGHTVMLTDDGTAQVYWDLETVGSEPWSPDSQRLAVFKTDVTGMATRATIHWLKPLEVADETWALQAGGIINRDELCILDVYGTRSLQVDLGDTTDHYLNLLGWLPDGSELLVARYDRLFRRVEILAADPATGTTRLVLAEESNTFLSSQLFLFRDNYTGFWLLPDGSGFIWRSERDGWSHLYRYDLRGELLARLTSGEFPVINVTRIDQKGGWVYFQAHGDATRVYDNHLFRVSLDGGEMQQLTEGKGRHTIAMSPTCEVFLDTFSSVDTPPQTVLRRAHGTMLQVLAEADISRLKTVGWVPSKEYVVKAADGETDLWVTIHFPYNFDPEKKYPIFEDIYAGPQVNKRVMDFGATRAPNWEMTNFPRALAQLGFLVLTVDGRGTPGRSKAFHDAIYRNWGQFEIADHAGAITQLAARLPFIDLDRVAVSGASWGGHYTFRALTQAPDVYRFGIPVVPEYDSRAHTLYEPFLGCLPADCKEVYDVADALALAPQLKGTMLQITGANDISTLGQFFRMSEALIRLGIHHDTMVYPNAGHGWFGATARYDNALKSRWLMAHMQP